MGCQHGLLSNQKSQIRCTFADKGFRLSPTQRATPCVTAYHTTCLSVGEPFKTRRGNHTGLTYPKIKIIPNFICEACTVRMVLGRELRTTKDITLLMLERVSLLDRLWGVSPTTFKCYQNSLSVVTRFENTFQLQGKILQPVAPKVPPHGPSIPLAWCQELYSLRPSPRVRALQAHVTLALSTIKQIRSAVSHYAMWDAMVVQDKPFVLNSRQQLIQQDCRFTDANQVRMHALGMSQRLGTNSSPSAILLPRHIAALDTSLELRYAGATTTAIQKEVCQAALLNLILWLGWLRSAEARSLRWCDLQVVFPENAKQAGLPENTGLIALTLLPQTKTSRTATADVIIAYETMSGLSPGKWFKRLIHICNLSTNSTSTELIFAHANKEMWTSLFFRTNFLYPMLQAMQFNGDSHLSTYSLAPGNTLEEHFWALHSYRRGARTHVSKAGIPGQHKSRPPSRSQLYEHARWSMNRSSAPIDLQYQAVWSPRDRLWLTLLHF